ncbi:hypothetical protein NLJ89_g7134 [Agrocybe chaxingu]|uniref:Uncharacterized protein n=1 Tax=Agrocybe chaxingu TaxID=84603 RepID=A0A9W8JXE1_9AGAR|nr:hypothetical protein NLJ89_g7134 [Agrocybe chaxingu]
MASYVIDNASAAHLTNQSRTSYRRQKQHPDVAYRLQSLDAFLQNKSTTRLSLATTTISSQNAPLGTSIASVVVSTALHASILHHSEALRDRHPGIERFKLAAQQNSAKWYTARLKLTPSSLGFVQIYNPSSNSLIPHPDSSNESPAVEIQGPFAYFLSTVNVDRLEPAFRITPLARAIPSSTPAFDIVVLRPLRDPTVDRDTPEARASFVPKTWKVLGGAYQDGQHVEFVYTEQGDIASGLHGASVIEYFRCGGWEWTPDQADPDAHLVCSDGAISTIPPHGKASAAVDSFSHHFSVYN